MLSFWMSEGVWQNNPSPWWTLPILIWYSPILVTFNNIRMESSLEYLTEMLLSCIFGASVVKYSILSDNRCINLNAVIDCLFFTVCNVVHIWSSLQTVECEEFYLILYWRGSVINNIVLWWSLKCTNNIFV